MAKTENVDMVLVMGLSGAGKSYFINTLTGAQTDSEDEVKVGKRLKSCTKKCQAVATAIGNTDFVIVDCPGFDDTERSDTEILKEITETLSALYIVGLKLRGVIYLQRITDNRMQGSSMKNLQLFVKMVGKECLTNVVFVTTMWRKLNDEDIAEANNRDSELRDEYWADFINMGASATRFEGSQASAEGILSILLGKRDVVLKVQNELVNARKSLKQTEAGEFLEPTVHQQEIEFKARVEELEGQLNLEKDNGRRLDYKRRQKRAQAGKEQRQKDKITLESRPGEEARKKLENFKQGSFDLWKNALQALAAVVSIGAAITGIIITAAG